MRRNKSATGIQRVASLSGLAFGACAAGQVLHVDAAAPAGGNGLSWATALSTLQDALALAAGSGGQVNDIRVSQGTYRPDRGGPNTPGSRIATFALQTGLAVRGGFAGRGAPNPDLRDPIAFPTVLSGDLAGNDGPSFVNRQDNSYHVVTARNTASSAVLDGVTIAGGYASGNGFDAHGAALIVTDGSATLTGCLLRDSEAVTRAGGIAAFNSTVTVTESVFSGLRGYQGGAVYFSVGELRLIDCEMLGNAAQTGGAALMTQTTALLQGCRIAGSIRLAGSGSTGGAVNTSQTILTVLGCMFEQNAGGGLASEGPRLLVDQSMFRENSGSGIASAETFASITRSTFVRNRGTGGAGVTFESGASGRALVAGGTGGLNEWNGSAWSAVGAVTPTESGVRALAEFNDGSGSALYAGGTFAAAGGAATRGIVRYRAGGLTAVGGGMNGDVHALAVFADSSGPALYGAGSFTQAGGVDANRIARWNGTTWAPLGQGMDDTIEALAVFDSGGGASLYAAGRFQMAGGVPVARIARWDGQNWSGLGVGLDSAALSLGGGTPGGVPALVAGGEFLNAGGSPASRIAAWTGTQWAALRAGADASVRVVRPWDGGARIYAGGDFVSIGGVGAARIARWDGSAWAALGAGVNGRVRAIAAYTDESQSSALYAAGEFTMAGGIAAQRVARWNGLAWSALGSGQPSAVLALEGYTKRQRMVRDCLFLGNDAQGSAGGGVFGGDLIVGSIFSGNAAGEGGAIYAGATDVVNCTLVANTATGRGGGICVGAGTGTQVRVSNCVVYFNSDGFGALQDSQIYASTPLGRPVNFSCVENFTGSWGGAGNHWLNPLFVDRDGPDNITGTDDDNLRVNGLSPLIDRASIARVPLALTGDADGNPRIADGDGNGSRLLDIGAYEYPAPSCYANCDGSSAPPILNVNDFLCFQTRFAAGDPYANCDGSTNPPVLNVADFICFLGSFAQGCP